MPDDKTGDMYATGARLADIGIQLKQKADVANMNNFAAQSQLDMASVTNDWRVKNEGNPTDPKAIDELHQSYDGILNQYDDKIGFVSRGMWAQTKNKIKSGYQEQNLDWGIRQAEKNIKISVNESINSNLQMAFEYGKAGTIDQARKHYELADVGLSAASVGIIGSETHKELLGDFKSDYIKSFVMGKAEASPDEALSLLEDKQVISDIGNEKDVLTLKSFALKQKKVAKEALEVSQIGNGLSLLQEFSQKAPTAADIPRLSKMGANGDISPELAQAAVRYITSPESIDDYDDKGLVKYLDAIYEAKDQKLINSASVDVLNGGSDGKASMESVARLVKVAADRGAQLDVKNGKGVTQESKQGVFDGVFKAVKGWVTQANLDKKKENDVMKDFLFSMSTAKPDADPSALYNDVIKRAVIREHPEVSAQKEIPTMVYSQDESLYTIFNSPATVYPHKLYDPKSKTMVNNPNREITNK
jgi:hypothetical protein